MRNHGQRREVISKDDSKAFAEWHSPEREDPEREDPEREDPEREDPEREDPEREDPERENTEDDGDKELSVTKKQMSRWIKEVRQESHF
jgi:hypothetical protein